MEKQFFRSRTKRTLRLMTEKKDGTIIRRTINSAAIEGAAALLFGVAVAITCKFIYDSITIRDARKTIIEQKTELNNLTDENEALTVENSTLTNKGAVLSEAVSKKAEAEDVLSQETIENALPKGFPLSGSATMTQAQEGEPMLIFSASSGINVVTTGTGIVEVVDADETYGTKIVIDHGNGYRSIYRNGAAALVKQGESLGKGYILFSIGKDNEELGYQITLNEEYIDPMTMIEING